MIARSGDRTFRSTKYQNPLDRDTGTKDLNALSASTLAHGTSMKACNTRRV